MFSAGSPEEQPPTLGEMLAGLAKALAKAVLVCICILVGLGIVGWVGVAVFGNWFKADKSVLKETAEAQADITRALFLTFDDSGRLDVRLDYSVYAYIPKKNYMLMPYPDRDEAITIVGKTWCKNKRVIWFSVPKVVLRDIHSGEGLGSYRCLRGWLR